MKEFGKTANLKGHVTGQGILKKTVYGPGDIEGHKGKVKENSEKILTRKRMEDTIS
jgi:hypothetical protein